MADIYQLEENDVAKYMKSHVKAVDGLLDFVHPIGSIYQSTNSTSPELLFGGTWERFGNGRVLVGVNESDADFTAGKTGGSKTVTLTTEQMPKHTHGTRLFRGGNPPGTGGTDGYTWGEKAFSSGNQVTESAGNGEAHSNLQPYQTVYIWKRTA